MLILYLISTALYCKHRSYSPGERSEANKTIPDQEQNQLNDQLVPDLTGLDLFYSLLVLEP